MRALQARACRIAAMALVIAGCGDKGGTEPVQLEALPVTLETVQAAVTFMTTGQVAIPPSCGGSPVINCANGVAGTPTLVTLTPTGVTVAEVSPGIYSFSVPMSVVTMQPVPVSFPLVGTCGVSVNTAPGASATALLSGTATFTTHGESDEINRIDLAGGLSGVATEDVTLTGGIGCAVASVGLGFAVDILSNSIADRAAHLCGAPGPPLLFACPSEE